ncbi:MAG: dTMP kinase [Gemmatimonadaceae bacterium]
MSTRRGALVVFEGAEGVGKSTQLRRLAKWLEREKIFPRLVREPGGTPLGDEIRRLVLDTPGSMDPRAEALLFMASRAQLVSSVIAPALAHGELVLADRFFLSTYAYQIGGRGLPQNDVRSANAVATNGLVPSLTVLLTLPVSESLQRMRERAGHGPDRIESAEENFHRRVAEAFAAFAAPEWQLAHPEAGPIVQIDASGSEDEVEHLVVSAVRNVLSETISFRTTSNR